MPDTDPFDITEAQYAQLKAQVDAGQIKREQLEMTLRDWTVQDQQGRLWRLEPRDGKWYVKDRSGEWAEATPPGRNQVTLPNSPTPAQKPPPKRAAQKPSRLSLFAAGCLILFCLIGVAGIALVVGVGYLGLFPRPQPLLVIETPSAPPVALAPTATLTQLVPTPTTMFAALATGTPTLTSATAAASSPAATLGPFNTPSPTGAVLPTLTLAPTATATNTRVIATATATLTPTATVPPGFFVTGFRTDPSPAKSNQEVGFFVTFNNNVGSPQAYRWKVYIFRQDNLKRSLGETPPMTTSVPPGVGEFKAGAGWKTKTNGCENFLARISSLDDSNRITQFLRPDGQFADFWFTMCP